MPKRQSSTRTITMTKAEVRPIGITALSLFFLFGAGASFVSFISLLFPGSFLEPIWRLNPRARAGLGGMGVWAVIWMGSSWLGFVWGSVGVGCGPGWGFGVVEFVLGRDCLVVVLSVFVRMCWRGEL